MLRRSFLKAVAALPVLGKLVVPAEMPTDGINIWSMTPNDVMTSDKITTNADLWASISALEEQFEKTPCWGEQFMLMYGKTKQSLAEERNG